jgi:hypothetical protein
MPSGRKVLHFNLEPKHPKALSASNSSEQAGTRHSYAAVLMGCKKLDAKRDFLAEG